MNRQSIRFRLTAWYAVILAVTFAAVGIGAWIALRSSINDTVDKDLRSRLQAMRDYLQRQATRTREGAVEELREDAALAPAGTRFRISDNLGRWLYESPGTQGWETAPADIIHLPKRGRIETIVYGGKPIRVLSAAAPLGMVQIGIPLDEFREMLDAFTWTVLLASPVLLLLASAGGYWMSRRALDPVERITRTAGEIEAQNLSKRLPLPGTGDELDRLSKTLNAMFARLEDSFRRITQFTADASHELRTPIAIIRTTAEVARRKPRSDREYAEALDRILAESERTTELIEDLMSLARADANADDTVLEPVRLDQLVQAVCAQARETTIDAELTLTVGAIAPCTISGDSTALRRLLIILLDNAVKYSNRGGAIRIDLTSCRWSGQAAAMLQVHDNGIGISPEDLPHIFERFYRASKDRSRKIDGVGLGLSIARSIAHRHGGEIEVDSQVGTGTVVRVYLPTL
jgi:heavy metal sensor kinase